MIPYGGDVAAAVESIAAALIASAKHFESNCERYVSDVARSLSAEALVCLRTYGAKCAQMGSELPSMFVGEPPEQLPQHFKDKCPVLYQQALAELIQRRLLYTDYKVGAGEGGVDYFGAKATDLGRSVIEHMWSELARPT